MHQVNLMTVPATTKKRHKFHLPQWAHGAAYAAMRAAAAAVNIAGAEPSMRFLRAAGGAYASLPINRRRLNRAIENISWCFPEWEQDLVRDYAVEAYRHLFCLAAELVLSPRLLNEDGFARHVELGRLKRGLLALSSDRPCILITGHCGNWELLGATLAMLGFPMHALYRPLDLSALDSWLQTTRLRQGIHLVDKFRAAETLPPLLEQRKPLGFIADQNAGNRGLYVPFFNRLASTYKTIGLLAIRFNAVVICGHAQRLSGLTARTAAMNPATPPSHEARESQSFRYRVDVVDLFGPEDWSGRPDPLFYITARYRRAIEQMIRRAPEQCLWMHRYWKTRPPHERRGQPFPAQLREKIASLPWMDDDDVEQIIDRSNRDSLALRH